jgi:NTE family protein
MRIALALSGGGTRAAVFHLGVLQRLAAGNLLEFVTRISTVSGGSLAMALVFERSKLAWPTSAGFLNHVYPAVAGLLSSTALFDASVIAASPAQWVHIARGRARILSNLLSLRWGVRSPLIQLPDVPEWQINATCIETGRNWRFSKHVMGDWVFGHCYKPPFTIAEAAAASAAVPYVLGALQLRLPREGWYDIDPGTDRPRGRKEALTPVVHLWDGGAYENMGLEPLYKLDRGMIGCDYIVVSDASGPLPVSSVPSALSLLRGNLSAPRLFDVASDQIRSLRSRMFVHALTTGHAKGALIRMGNSVRDIDIKTGKIRTPADYLAFQQDRDVTLALRHPTNLSSLRSDDFERVARHGFELADATLTAYCRDLGSSSLQWTAGGIVSA